MVNRHILDFIKHRILPTKYEVFMCRQFTPNNYLIANILNSIAHCLKTPSIAVAGSTEAGFGKKVNDYHIAAITIGEGNVVNGSTVTPTE